MSNRLPSDITESKGTETSPDIKAQGKNKPSFEVKRFDSFNLDEMQGGGPQMIIDYVAISPTEYYVQTLGKPPKDIELEVESQGSDDIRIRFFKLTHIEGCTYSIMEAVTPKSITEVAKRFLEKNQRTPIQRAVYEILGTNQKLILQTTYTCRHKYQPPKKADSIISGRCYHLSCPVPSKNMHKI